MTEKEINRKGERESYGRRIIDKRERGEREREREREREGERERRRELKRKREIKGVKKYI
jgi:hypothetical protein